METSPNEIQTRARDYAATRTLEFEDSLGFGFDGIVYSTQRQSAVKVFRYEQLYLRERDVYFRLQYHEITQVFGFKVPRLIDFDDVHWVVEMTVVSPPFVLDFAGAYLDQRPDYPAEVLAEWHAEKAEQFGDRWPTVRLLISSFVPFGIYLADVKPGNIEFAGSGPTGEA